MESESALGVLTIFFVFLLPIYALAFYMYWKVITKAGYNGCFGLILLVIPIVNLIAIFYFVFSEWPIQKELRELKEKQKEPKLKVEKEDPGLIERNG